MRLLVLAVLLLWYCCICSPSASVPQKTGFATFSSIARAEGLSSWHHSDKNALLLNFVPSKSSSFRGRQGR